MELLNKMLGITKSKPSRKSTNEIIDEIHETFFTEVDRLLATAKIEKPVDTDKQDLIDKAKRLEKLGFNSAKEVQDGLLENMRLADIRKENEVKKDLVDAINYFSFKYPHYKFITEDSVKSICEKYNLVYSEIENYIGTVPDENIYHMESFKIDESDSCYVIETEDLMRFWGRESNKNLTYISKE